MGHLGDHFTTKCRLLRMSVFVGCLASYFDMAFPESSAVFSFKILSFLHTGFHPPNVTHRKPGLKQSLGTCLGHTCPQSGC